MTSRLRQAVLTGTLVVLVSACGGTAASLAPSASDEASIVATPTAEPSATASEPSVEATPSESASQTAGGAFAVAPNPDADALFLDRDECTNEADGYRLSFPDAWYTNTAVGDVEPCRWFSPTSYTVDDPRDVPAEIAITIEHVTGDSGSFEEVLSREFGIVGETQEAVRVEYRGAAGNGGQMPPEWHEYRYQVQLGPTPEGGPNLIVRTNTDMGGDYELNKAVLDRIMATIEFIGTIE